MQARDHEGMATVHPDRGGSSPILEGRLRWQRFGWAWIFLLAWVSWSAELPPDTWLEGDAVAPESVREPLAAPDSDLTASLRAEILAGRLKIIWEPPDVLPGTNVQIWASADAPGHWAARDWRRYPMTRGDTLWETSLPVDDVDVPYLYLLQVESGGSDQRGLRSAIRIVLPRRLGLEQPTRVFWAFLEGFEEGLESWKVLAAGPEESVIRLSDTTRNGKAALQVTVPEGKRSMTVATTRVRGWQIMQQGATGLSLWMRTEAGRGRARFTLHARAFETNQVLAPYRREFELGPTWQRVELSFAEFRDAALAATDLVSIDLVGQGPCRFLLDDMQFLGHWPLE